MNTTISEERLAANRANAQKSTGPKTTQGKNASKMNAMKHGILSREVLVAGEDYQEFTAMQEWFEDDLQPVGPLEFMLVGQIVATHWRLRRMLAAESGEIKREADFRQAARSNAQSKALEETADGCRQLQTLLSHTLQSVEREGELTLGEVIRFSGLSGEQSHPLKRDLNTLLFRHRDQKQETGEVGREQRKQEVVNYVNDQLVRLAAREVECRKKEEAASQLPPLSGILPGAEAMNRFMRYESMLNRQLFRAMKELRTLQKQREEKQKVETVKAVGSSEAEGRSENLRNEAIARGAPVQGSEFKVQSAEELRNEAIEEKQTAEMQKAEGGSNSDGRSEKLPNEPIPSAQLSEISNLKSQMTGNLPNEATAEEVK